MSEADDKTLQAGSDSKPAAATDTAAGGGDKPPPPPPTKPKRVRVPLAERIQQEKTIEGAADDKSQPASPAASPNSPEASGGLTAPDESGGNKAATIAGWVSVVSGAVWAVLRMMK